MSGGKWNAVESPVCPCERRNLNRAFVSAADPNPANWRIVHSRPRYIVGCTPRVYGYWPGYPRSSSYSRFERGSGVYRRSISSSETVENRSRRCGDFRRLGVNASSCHFFRWVAIPASFFLSYMTRLPLSFYAHAGVHTLRVIVPNLPHLGDEIRRLDDFRRGTAPREDEFHPVGLPLDLSLIHISEPT